MFNLKYTLTAADLKAENKKLALFYFALYFTVALIGLAVGIVAVVINPQVTMLVLGIVIIVFAALLLAVALLLLIAPKNLVVGVVDEDVELDVTVDKHGITVNGQNLAPFADVTKVKNRKAYLVVYFGKDKVFLVKDAVTSGQTLNELCAYMTERQGRILLEVPEGAAPQKEQETATESEQVENAQGEDSGEKE